MAQHDYDIANAAGATVRADINNVLAAIVRKNDGATAPTTTFPGMWWYETDTNLLQIRNEADNAWIIFAEFDQTNGLWIPRAIDYLRIEERSTDPTNVANVFLLYCKDDAADTELYGRDDSGNIIQITLDGGIRIPSLKILSEVQGDILYRDATGWVRLGPGTSGQFLKTQGAAANPVWAAGVGVLQTISFGGFWDGVGNFLQANGSPGDVDGISDQKTRHGVVAGTINTMVFFHEGILSSNNATIKIHVDGSVVKTLTAVGGGTSSDVFTSMAIVVTSGQRVEVEFDAGSTNPGESIVTMMVE